MLLITLLEWHILHVCSFMNALIRTLVCLPLIVRRSAARKIQSRYTDTTQLQGTAQVYEDLIKCGHNDAMLQLHTYNAGTRHNSGTQIQTMQCRHTNTTQVHRYNVCRKMQCRCMHATQGTQIQYRYPDTTQVHRYNTRHTDTTQVPRARAGTKIQCRCEDKPGTAGDIMLVQRYIACKDLGTMQAQRYNADTEIQLRFKNTMQVQIYNAGTKIQCSTA